MSSSRNNIVFFIPFLLSWIFLIGCGSEDTIPVTRPTQQVLVPANLVGYWQLSHYRPANHFLKASITISETGAWQSETNLPLITGGYLSVRAKGTLSVQKDQIKSQTESVITILPTSQLPVKMKMFDGQINFELINDKLILYYEDGSMAIYQLAKK